VAILSARLIKLREIHANEEQLKSAASATAMRAEDAVTISTPAKEELVVPIPALSTAVPEPTHGNASVPRPANLPGWVPKKPRMQIFMATPVFGESFMPQGLLEEQVILSLHFTVSATELLTHAHLWQIAAETDTNDGKITCSGHSFGVDVHRIESTPYDSPAAANSDFWIFHCRDMPDVQALNREVRQPWHLWVWFCEEHEPGPEDEVYNSVVFNLSMTMRLESDIPISYLNTDRDMMDALGPRPP
jgi:hypothetical protein